MRKRVLAAGAALLAVGGLALAAPRGATGPAELVGAFEWREAWQGFGGYSAIELDGDGEAFFIQGDSGALVSGRLVRDGRGLVTAVEADEPVHMLLDAAGERLRGERGDSEGLALGPDGALWVSFEGRGEARVRLEGEPPVDLAGHPDFAGLQRNSSLEALAVDADGALYAIPERSGARGRPFPVYRHRDGAWDVAFALPRRGRFLVAGADVGPDGRLYVLERAFDGVGFRSRVRRVHLDGTGEETVLETATRTHDNLEGIAVWEDRAGRFGGGLRATLVSDDNFRWYQTTEIVDYRLPD